MITRRRRELFFFFLPLKRHFGKPIDAGAGGRTESDGVSAFRNLISNAFEMRDERLKNSGSKLLVLATGENHKLASSDRKKTKKKKNRESNMVKNKKKERNKCRFEFKNYLVLVGVS